MHRLSRDHSICFTAAIGSNAGAEVYTSATTLFGTAAHAQPGLSAGGLSEAASTINAPKGGTVSCRMPRYIEIGHFAGVWSKLRLREQGQPRDRVERRFCFLPLDARVFNPEVGVVALAPIGHPVGVEQLDAKVETAHPAVFVEVPDQLILQAFWVILLQRTRQIVRRGNCRV